MAKMEQIELEAYRSEIVDGLKSLVEKYRAIFDWDVPEIDHKLADKLILAEIRHALADVEKDLLS